MTYTLTDEAADDRTNDIAQEIDEAADAIADVVDDLTSKLSTLGAFRVHRSWDRSVERQELAKAAAAAAIRVLMKNGWVDLPDEVQALWREAA